MTDTGMVRAPAPIRLARAARAGCRRPAVAAALAALLLVLAPAAARASGGLVVTDYGFPSIVVIGNGHRYTGVSALGYAWKVAVDIDTGTLGRIKEWQIWPVLTVEGQPPLELKVYGFHTWYPSASDPWPRPKSVKKHVALLFPDA
jgi:hypothetical protein